MHIVGNIHACRSQSIKSLELSKKSTLKFGCCRASNDLTDANKERSEQERRGVMAMDSSNDSIQFASSQFTFPPFANSDLADTNLPDSPQRFDLWAASSSAFKKKAEDRERVLLDHLPTVRSIAHRIHERLPDHVELDDLISAGVVGLIDAFNKFDHRKQVQFKSYAQFRIRGAILDSLRVLDWSPRELRRKGRLMQDAILALTRSLQRVPTEPEIAREMNLDLKEYQRLIGQLKGLEIGSLNLENNEDSGEDQLGSIPASPQDDPLFCCLQGEIRQRLIDAIEELSEKERMVLTLYYFEELTMKEIGVALGVVESRVSQIHSSAVQRLRSRLRVAERIPAQLAAPRRSLSTPCDC
jgi:RNA polymerase sigma factor for flagellar operon FliA